jgi:drug/metabolite transporter (DMT)-like permease
MAGEKFDASGDLAKVMVFVIAAGVAGLAVFGVCTVVLDSNISVTLLSSLSTLLIYVGLFSWLVLGGERLKKRLDVIDDRIGEATDLLERKAVERAVEREEVLKARYKEEAAARQRQSAAVAAAAAAAPPVGTLRRPQPRLGIGCQRCGSTELVQRKYTSGVGWVVFIVGLFLAPFCIGFVLILVALGLTEYRTICRDCGFTN